MGCFHCSCCCKASNDSGMQFRSREGTVGCFRCPKLLSDKENGGNKSRISSQRNDDLPEKNHCCFSCMKPSKANSEFTRKEYDGNCFAWFMTSNKVNERRRGSRIDSSSCCHSKTKDDSTESRGCCCCFPYFRKSSKDAHSRNELKDKNCTFCLCPLGSSKKKKEATRNGCAERFCCKESLPKDDSTKRKGICYCSCVPPKKLSKIGIDYNAESKNKNSFLCFSSTTAEAKDKNKKGCGIGRSDCCDTSSKEDSTGKSGHYCCSCFSRKKSANKKIDSRERKNINCFYCFMSSKDEGKEGSKNGCGIGCSCCCDSSSKHFSTERKGHRCCSCFPHKKSSKIEIESRRERKCKEVGKARNKTGFGNGCLCCCDSLSKEDSAEQRGHFCCKCFSHTKLSRREIDSRDERMNKNCISCFGSSKEKGKERNKNECGVGCTFCFDSSLKDDSTEGSGHFQCCCFPHKKPSKQDNDFRGESNNKQYFSCFRSSKEEDLGRNNKGDEIGCSCCSDSSSKHPSPKSNRSLCLYPSRSSKEGSDSKKGKGNGCFSCFKLNKEDSSIVEKKENSCCSCNMNKKKTGQDSAKKRGSKVMCCSAFCCTKSLEEGKPASKAKCTFGCICCVHSDCYQHMPIDRRKKSLCSYHVQEQPQIVNRSSTMMQIPSLESDIDGKNRSHANQIAPLSNCSNSVQVFKYKELVAATKSFSEDFLLGSGAIGGTYKGELLENNQVVAIKEIKRDVNQGGNEFHVDVIMLSLIHHANLVKLLGYCAEREQMILVSEYMPFGSLQDHLFDLKPNNKPLDWFTRMKIATGVAKGLEHLHDISNPPIVFRDMKASNILLDEDYNAKLSDFGLEKPLSVMGTYGCCAPEYALTRKFTKTTDVYGFGVLLLELITGRKAIDSTRPKKEQYLSQWVAPLFKDKRRFLTLVDPLLNGCYPIKGLYQALAIANICLQNEANGRPFMSDVVTAIEYLVKPEADLSKSLEEPSIPHQSIPSNYEMLMLQHSPRNSCRRKNTMSFDEESFQSLASDTECCGPLREEDDIQEEE